MPVRDEGIFNMSDTSDQAEPQTPKVTTQWQSRRAFLFHECIDTKRTIWPFTKAYSKVFMHSRPSPQEGIIDIEWLSAEAYTFRKLTKK